jgi:arginyl-tRNA--protein-N-Asp/Glu arginylyltransferase
MNQQTGLRLPSFYMTEPAPCPYIEGEQERKLFTHLMDETADALHNELTHAGFRRSQGIAYRPACENCYACRSVRICVDGFTCSKNMRRIIATNNGLTCKVLPPEATREQFELLRKYLDGRHADGDMANLTSLDFISMVQDTMVDTQVVEYRDLSGQLIACLLQDKLNDGLSLVYSFFDPDLRQRSLGSFIILDSIARAKESGLAYVYLGYFVSGSKKMAYKSRYKPMQELGANGWVDLQETLSGATIKPSDVK